MVERIQGRGAAFNPGNRFERLHLDELSDEFSDRFEAEEKGRPKTVYYTDSSRSILARNDSPDIPFTFSVNPYRGCEHGCVYCYARPTHEFLGFSAGLDFETKIMVKMDAPILLESALRHPSFEPQVISISGNTDPYQPVERKLKLTRACLEVFLKYKNPVGIVTKNALILRDLDILKEMAKWNLISVAISITSLDRTLISKMEPRTSTPEKRLQAIRDLSAAGVPVGVNAAPIIPGFTDQEIPEILAASARNGATSAHYILVRLPFAVKELFEEWMRREFPARAEKVLNRVREIRGGKLNDPRFESRMTGEGEFADMIAALFETSCRKHGLNQQDDNDLSTEHFQHTGQLPLF